MSISDFERERLANIQRNKELLEQLDLNGARDSVARAATPKPTPSKRRATRAPTAKREAAEPTRRSRRIAGSKSEQEDPKEYERLVAEQDEKDRQRKELERLRLTRLFGDFSLLDLISDNKLGSLVNENAVISKGFNHKNDGNLSGTKQNSDGPSGVKEEIDDRNGIKREADDSSASAQESRPKRSRTNAVKQLQQSEPSSEDTSTNGTSVTVKEENESQLQLNPDTTSGTDVVLPSAKTHSSKVLDILRSLGERFSTGDLYNEIRGSSLDKSDENLESERRQFDALKIFPKYDPLDIKITHTRITAIGFHRAVEDRIIAAGDTSGHVGIWAVDSSMAKDEEDASSPAISILKPHGRAVSKILLPASEPSKLFSSSYDGSIRSHDIAKTKSSEVAYLNDPWESNDLPLGVSDMNFCPDNANVLYITTLSGNFFKHDLREKFEPVRAKDLLRLHDKKIGGFSINPNAPHQIATASLDRTYKIWDLRNVSKLNASWLEFDDQSSPHLYGGYTSRLSVSCIDWNHENRLVCNGYDDKISLVDLSGSKSTPCVTSWSKNYVPGTMGGDEVLANINPATTIRHNCQTGRWVSILKLRWQQDPQDGVQKFIIANMNRGLDVYDQNGQIIAHLSDSVGAVPAVSTLHPTQNWAVGGLASGKMYLFV